MKWKNILYFVIFFRVYVQSGKETRVVQEKYSFLNDDAFIVLVSGECLIAQILQKKNNVTEENMKDFHT